MDLIPHSGTSRRPWSPAVLAWLLAVAPAAAGPQSASFIVEPAAAGQGGRAATSPTRRISAAVQEAGAAEGQSASTRLRAGVHAGLPQPRKVTDLEPVERSSYSVRLDWTAPAADQERSTGTAARYLIRFSTVGPIATDADFAAATVYNNNFAPLPPGLLESRQITGLDPNTTYYFVLESANEHSVRAHRSVSASTVTLPGEAPAAPVVEAVALSSVAVSYGAPAGAPDGYVVQAATAADFIGDLLKSSSTSNTALLSLSPQGLDSNTTYYLRAGALWNGATSYAGAAPASTSTLARAPQGVQVFARHVASITVNWIELPAGPQKDSAEGYRLEASTAADFTGTIQSSATTGVALSTLTVAGLSGDATYYFRAGSLNWNGTPNYAAALSTYLPAVFGVEIIELSYAYGGLNLGVSSITAAQLTVENNGNMAGAFWLRAATVTANSPWTLSTDGTPDAQNEAMLRATFHAARPSDPNFASEDLVTDISAASQGAGAGGRYTVDGSEEGVSVAPGQSRRLWLRMSLPRVSTTQDPQTVQVTVRIKP